MRPAVVIQNDLDNTRLLTTIVAQITGNVQRAGERTQVLIDVSTPDGKQSGLLYDSVVNCVNIATLDKGQILRRRHRLGVICLFHCVQLVDEALKASLDLA